MNYLKLLSFIISATLLCADSITAQVKIYSGTEIIPTYKIGADETSPLFYTGRSVQGAQGKIYPYASQAKLSDELTDVSYEMLYLENEYLIVKVLPAFGGRLFSAIDKTNGHELFHTNSVIKPDLIGTLGAWVSGGIEWCFPHHHRTTTMMPVDFRLVENENGSATIWIGETEKTIRARGVVGMTLHPGKSYIEVDYRINNTSTQTQSFLFWANVAVTSNEHFRTFWPPSSEIGVFHNNRSFIKWPISNKNDDYGSTEYEEGVDLTWWKNHPNPVSFFMWDVKDGFIGGYDYQLKAGTIHVGDPYENKASKLWQFGPGTKGQNARRKLTDDGKAYVELMTGTFSNNQPDYSWIIPHSVKDAKNFWYPLRDIEIAKAATVDAAVTLQMRGPKDIFYGVNTTQSFKNAKLMLLHKDETLVEHTLDIDPANPYSNTFSASNSITEKDLFIELTDANGKSLVSYKTYIKKNPELPTPQERVKKPEQIESVEDLYLTGRFVQQFNRPGKDPADYYLAAIEKSPDDYRANLAQGILMVNRTQYKEALDHLQTAADKLKVKYLQPKEGEIFYYMGLAQRGLGMLDEAYSSFAQAAWYYEWFSSANYHLAQLESQKGNFGKALEYIKEAYSTNNRDGRIIMLYSSLLRKHDQGDVALKLLDDHLQYDPLDFAVMYEKSLLNKTSDFDQWHNNMQDPDNNYLEIATHYVNAGLHEDGKDLLSSLKNPSDPLVNYYLAWFNSKLGQEDQALSSILQTKDMSLDYCFPYREETENILTEVIALDQQSSGAHYLLGNLLFDDRPDEAMQHWEEAKKIDDRIPMVWRNLAFAEYYQNQDASAAAGVMKKAINMDSSNPMWYAELVKYYDQSDLDNAECLAILKNNLSVMKQDVSAPKKYIELLNMYKRYDESIAFLEDHHFRTWEGGRDIYWHYVDAHTLKAHQLMSAKNYPEAIKHLEAALEYPENLEVGKPTHDEKNAMIYYYMAEAYKAMKKDDESANYYQKSANANNGRDMDELLYFQGKAHEKLGNKQTAQHLYQSLISKAKEMRSSGSIASLVAVEEDSFVNSNRVRSESYYLEALGNQGLGQQREANALFQQALDNYDKNIWAETMYESLK